MNEGTTSANHFHLAPEVFEAGVRAYPHLKVTADKFRKYVWVDSTLYTTDVTGDGRDSDTYEPGTVARIGWNMTSGLERALFDGHRWCTETGVAVLPSDVTEVYPLVVQELTAREMSEFAAKPPEPDGLGAVVVDIRGRAWVRKSCSVPEPWTSQIGGGFTSQAWDDVAAVRVLSSGVDRLQTD